jgi:hypothetical protein
MDGLAAARQVPNPQQARSQIASMAMAAVQLLREDWGTQVSGSRRRSTMADEVDALGPVGYLVAEFPGNKMTGEGFRFLSTSSIEASFASSICCSSPKGPMVH